MALALMPADPLAGPREKVARAREHLDALEANISEFLDSKPYDTPFEFDAKSGFYVFKLKVLKEGFPIRWPVIVGEAVYNLRSALDQLLWQLYPGGRPKNPLFPIYDDEIDFLYHSRRLLKAIDPAAQQLIKEFQPYHAGEEAQNHTLFVLNHIGNTDKHRYVHPSYANTANHPADLAAVFTEASPDGMAEVRFYPGVPLKDGAVVARVRLFPATPEADEPEVKMEGSSPWT